MPKRTSHPGVTLVRRKTASGVAWYGRTRRGGRVTEVCLARIGVTSAHQRLLWAERTSRELFAERRNRALGITTDATRTSPQAAVERFLADARARLRPRTVDAYEFQAGQIRRWLEAHGVGAVESITPSLLWEIRERVFLARGSAVTQQNRCRRSAAMLTWWRRAGLLPACTQDAIRDATESPPVPRPLPVVMRPEEIRAVLEAALRTGWGRGAAVALGLLLGTRTSEMVGLLWSQVDLAGGVVKIGAESKTRRGRVIDLAVCPAAVRILEALPRRAPRVLPWCRTSETVKGWATTWRRRPGVPKDWTWQHLRETCASYLVCAPGIYGGASAYLAARRLGHSVAVAERHYLGLVRVDPCAHTLEDAMGVTDVLERVEAACRAALSMNPS